jgi:hypothetical protein
MTRKDLQRKSALLVKILAQDYWLDYSHNLVKDLLEMYSIANYRKKRRN